MALRAGSCLVRAAWPRPSATAASSAPNSVGFPAITFGFAPQSVGPALKAIAMALAVVVAAVVAGCGDPAQVRIRAVELGAEDDFGPHGMPGVLWLYESDGWRLIQRTDVLTTPPGLAPPKIESVSAWSTGWANYGDTVKSEFWTGDGVFSIEGGSDRHGVFRSHANIRRWSNRWGDHFGDEHEAQWFHAATFHDAHGDVAAAAHPPDHQYGGEKEYRTRPLLVGVSGVTLRPQSEYRAHDIAIAVGERTIVGPVSMAVEGGVLRLTTVAESTTLTLGGLCCGDGILELGGGDVSVRAHISATAGMGLREAYPRQASAPARGGISLRLEQCPWEGSIAVTGLGPLGYFAYQLSVGRRRHPAESGGRETHFVQVRVLMQNRPKPYINEFHSPADEKETRVRLQRHVDQMRDRWWAYAMGRE